MEELFVEMRCADFHLRPQMCSGFPTENSVIKVRLFL